MNTQVDTPDWSKIPAPADDGAARHLTGMRIPSVPLPATDGTTVDLSVLTGLVVVYAYPRSGRPGVENPEGWDLIPGARGCTPQSCSFRDHFGELKSLGVEHVFFYPIFPPDQNAGEVLRWLAAR
jgi:Redoxin